MDMAIAYLRDHITDYEDVYDIIRRVGALLQQYEGDLGDDDQDYFAARSTIVAETVMNAAHGTDLRNMLQTFHANISPSRIPAYHVFRRKAYDSHLFLRAFQKTQEGASLYDEIYARELSPYVLQQKALFLADRREYSDAFREIDRALADTRGRNWTIQNSHAQILFRANIGKVNEYPEVRGTLDRSLQILQRCYSSDRRKGFHALTYADFARRYWRTYRDATAREYLERARLWLQEVQTQEPWLRRAPVLLRVVESHLSEAT
jgi:hypothetical protein